MTARTGSLLFTPTCVACQVLLLARLLETKVTQQFRYASTFFK